MTNFKQFSAAVSKQMDRMFKHTVLCTQTDIQLMKPLYLNAFPPGTNPVFRTNTEHDCSCCTSFIRKAGNLVAIIDGKLESIWDIDIEGFYKEVANDMAAYVKSQPIDTVFLHNETEIGTAHSYDTHDDSIKWNHFHYALPRSVVIHNNKTANRRRDIARHDKEGLQRSVLEITDDAVSIVLELIDNNQLYRGASYKYAVLELSRVKTAYKNHNGDKDILFWEESLKLGRRSRIKNTAIGTLLVDLSENVDVEHAVRSFEAMVAPPNYKRPKALVTKAQIKKAQEQVQELGIEDSLYRRHAVQDDITANNVLFIDRDVKKEMGIFDELLEEAKVTVKNNKVVSAEEFVNEVLPTVDSFKLIMENKHVGHLMSLVAPKFPEAKPIFKWGNNFSWSYRGAVADSIKERVKKAGGNVEGVLRCSLGWFNYDDLDIHVVEPDGNKISFSHPRSKSGGRLDVDMNVAAVTRNAVENIVWPLGCEPKPGVYELIVKNYTQREKIDVGFDAEIVCGNQHFKFHYDKEVEFNRQVKVATFNYSHEDGVTIIESIPECSASREVWGIKTNTAIPVSMVMHSPNHWDDRATGEKHLFFILRGCKTDEVTRGFYNEFLHNDFHANRKVFELLGAKMVVAHSQEQLSGVGFTAARGDEVAVEVNNQQLTIKF